VKKVGTSVGVSFKYSRCLYKKEISTSRKGEDRLEVAGKSVGGEGHGGDDVF